MNDICPCGIKMNYESCCGIFHFGLMNPQSAEALMRSRYSAFVLKKEKYLFKTWHVSKRPKILDLESRQIKWMGLKILRVEHGSVEDKIGIVEFIGEYEVAGKAGKIHEVSNFVKENSKWFYVDGEIIT